MDVNPNTSGESDPCKSCEGSPPEKVLSSGIQLRTSARVSKKLRQDQEVHAAAAVAAAASSNEKKVEVTVKEEKRRKAPWSVEEKAAFFEALNEHGKNFEAIENTMTLRAKKRGERSNKNKVQARNFYYRTWLKLSKYIKFPDSIGKVTQELYGLINFGELRKKVGKVTDKNVAKLSELVYCGSTQVRVRGKTWRVKTPVCPALRRLNNLQQNADEVKLPARAEVYLVGRFNWAVARVQALAHNPRVRTTLPLDTTLEPLISHLQTKWTTDRLGEELRVGPGTGLAIVRPRYRCGQIVSSAAVSLLAHEKRTTGHSTVLSQLGKGKSVLKWQREEAAGDEFINTEILDPAAPPNPPVAESVNVEHSEESKEEFEARIRRGWNFESAARIRIGQLYIMFGRDGALNLEYWWEDKEKDGGAGGSLEGNQLSKSLQKLLSVAKLYHLKSKVECPCGHVCRGKQTGGVQGKQGGVKKTKPGRPPEQPPLPGSTQCAQGSRSGSGDQVQGSAGTSSSSTSSSGSVEPVGRFKQPLLPAPPRPSPQASQALKALQQFRPKYCNRRGRARAKSQVVVQRMLLPKASAAPPVLVTLQVVPQGSTQVTGEFIRLNSETEEGERGEGVAPLAGSKQEGAPTPTTSTAPLTAATNPTFSGVLRSDNVDATPPSSPTSILREGDTHWLNSEVADFSLSSLLGHLESPLKVSTLQAAEDTRLSPDVETHFQSLMTESSLDYTAKFADLAAKIAAASSSTAQASKLS